jgi:hypothetical protein
MPTESLPLRDIHLPLPVGVWPLAPGWWFILSSLVAVVALILFLIKRYRRPTALKQSLKELDRLFGASEISHTQRNQEISLILKKLAVTTYPRGDVAGLAGQKWISWLQSKAPKSPLSGQLVEFIIHHPYCANNQGIQDVHALHDELTKLLAAIAKKK